MDLGQLRIAPGATRASLVIMIAVPILPTVFPFGKQCVGPGLFLKHSLQGLSLYSQFLYFKKLVIPGGTNAMLLRERD